MSQGGRSIQGDLRAVDQADRENGETLGVRADWQRLRLEGKGLEAGETICEGAPRGTASASTSSRS